MARRQAALMATGFVTLWEFTVSPSHRKAFESHYGPDGSWARLFRKAPGYVATEYEALDRECAGFTTHEAPLCEFGGH